MLNAENKTIIRQKPRKARRRMPAAVLLPVLFYAMFVLSFFWLFMHTVIKGYYQYQEVFLLAMIGLALLLFLFLWKTIKKHTVFLKKYGSAVTLGVIGWMFILQMIAGMILRYTPLYDIRSLYDGGIEWAETGTFASFYDYFSWYFNNFGGLYLFSLIFRAAKLFGVKDYFMTATLVNALLSSATIFVSGAAAKKLAGVRGQMMMYAFFVCSPPFYFIAPAFYTDALTMLFPVLIYWLYLLAKEQDKRSRRMVLYCLTGLACAAGICLKPTVAIVCVAILIDALFSWNWKRLLVMMLTVAVLVTAGNRFLDHTVSKHLDPERVETMRMPVLHWVMMGLTGDGIFNGADVDFVRSFEDPKEKSKAVQEEIKNRIRTLGFDGMVRLLTVKGDICFGDGTYGLSDLLGCGTRDGTSNWLQNIVVKEMEFYPYYMHICTGILLALYVFMLASGVHELMDSKSRSFFCLAPRLAVFGLLLFLICWEARWRYFSNYVPMIFLSALPGVEPFTQAVNKTVKKVSAYWRQKKEISA